ncbi:DoxX family protein [Actinoplanes sp. NPDC051470]|uniref:DoxX family protein n=1 Tax=Actinoplanes sp. NPDC051470 TaxID=3157224 RepID=UPI00342529D3
MYVAITVVVAVFAGIAAVSYLAGHAYPRAQLDMKRLPHSWMPMLGGLLAAGSLGLLAGLVIPVLGVVAAGGLVLYFAGALVAHLRVGSVKLAGWGVFFVSSIAALVVSLARF